MEEKELQIALLQGKKKVLNNFLEDRGNIGSCEIGLRVQENKKLATNLEDSVKRLQELCGRMVYA